MAGEGDLAAVGQQSTSGCNPRRYFPVPGLGWLSCRGACSRALCKAPRRWRGPTLSPVGVAVRAGSGCSALQVWAAGVISSRFLARQRRRQVQVSRLRRSNASAAASGPIHVGPQAWEQAERFCAAPPQGPSDTGLAVGLPRRSFLRCRTFSSKRFKVAALLQKWPGIGIHALLQPHRLTGLQSLADLLLLKAHRHPQEPQRDHRLFFWACRPCGFSTAGSSPSPSPRCELGEHVADLRLLALGRKRSMRPLRCCRVINEDQGIRNAPAGC